MTEKDKQLLLRDLCSRLPYKIFAQWYHKALNKFRNVKIMKISTYGKNIDDYYINVLCQPEPGVDYEASIVDIKPYLRPMSSMTEEEKRHVSKMTCLNTYDNGVVHDMTYPVYTPYYVMEDCLNYLRSINVDYSGLIEKGLALEAPEGMYDI